MDWSKTSETLSRLEMSTYLWLLGALLLLVALFWFLLRRQPRSIEAFHSDSGRVMVTRSAITELVQTSCQQIPDVARPSIKIDARGGRTDLEVRLKLRSGGHLADVYDTLKAHLRHSLEQNLGISNLGEINITVTGFKSGKLGERETSVRQPPKREAWEEETFTETEDEKSGAEGDEESGPGLDEEKRGY